MILGITGRVGSGKTTAAQEIAQIWQAHVIDLDKIGHTVLLESEVKRAVSRIFGPDMLDDTGAVIRARLSEKVFASPSALLRLNDITHPSLKKIAIAEIQKTNGHTVVVGALLIALGLRPYVNKVLVIDADDAHIQAVVGEKFDKIAPHQISQDAYRRQGDIIIENTHDNTFITRVQDWAKTELAQK